MATANGVVGSSKMINASDGYTVELYIYDISNEIKSSLASNPLDLDPIKLWHTGVVAYGREYFFGASGIQSCTPGSTVLGEPYRIDEIGESEVPYQLFLEYIFGLAETSYKPGTYSFPNKNCNTFTDEVSQFLCGTGIPKEIAILSDQFSSGNVIEVLEPILKSLQIRRVDSKSISFGAATSSSISAYVPHTLDRGEDDKEFDELNSAIDDVRNRSLFLEDRRNSLNEKLLRREKRERKKKKKEKKENGEAGKSERKKKRHSRVTFEFAETPENTSLRRHSDPAISPSTVCAQIPKLEISKPIEEQNGVLEEPTEMSDIGESEPQPEPNAQPVIEDQQQLEMQPAEEPAPPEAHSTRTANPEPQLLGEPEPEVEREPPIIYKDCTDVSSRLTFNTVSSLSSSSLFSSSEEDSLSSSSCSSVSSSSLSSSSLSSSSSSLSSSDYSSDSTSSSSSGDYLTHFTISRPINGVRYTGESCNISRAKTLSRKISSSSRRKYIVDSIRNSIDSDSDDRLDKRVRIQSRNLDSAPKRINGANDTISTRLEYSKAIKNESIEMVPKSRLTPIVMLQVPENEPKELDAAITQTIPDDKIKVSYPKPLICRKEKDLYEIRNIAENTNYFGYERNYIELSEPLSWPIPNGTSKTHQHIGKPTISYLSEATYKFEKVQSLYEAEKNEYSIYKDNTNRQKIISKCALDSNSDSRKSDIINTRCVDIEGCIPKINFIDKGPDVICNSNREPIIVGISEQSENANGTLSKGNNYAAKYSQHNFTYDREDQKQLNPHSPSLTRYNDTEIHSKNQLGEASSSYERVSTNLVNNYHSLLPSIEMNNTSKFTFCPVESDKNTGKLMYSCAPNTRVSNEIFFNNDTVPKGDITRNTSSISSHKNEEETVDPLFDSLSLMSDLKDSSSESSCNSNTSIKKNSDFDTNENEDCSAKNNAALNKKLCNTNLCTRSLSSDPLFYTVERPIAASEEVEKPPEKITCSTTDSYRSQEITMSRSSSLSSIDSVMSFGSSYYTLYVVDPTYGYRPRTPDEFISSEDSDDEDGCHYFLDRASSRRSVISSGHVTPPLENIEENAKGTNPGTEVSFRDPSTIKKSNSYLQSSESTSTLVASSSSFNGSLDSLCSESSVNTYYPDNTQKSASVELLKRIHIVKQPIRSKSAGTVPDCIRSLSNLHVSHLPQPQFVSEITSPTFNSPNRPTFLTTFDTHDDPGGHLPRSEESFSYLSSLPVNSTVSGSLYVGEAFNSRIGYNRIVDAPITLSNLLYETRGDFEGFVNSCAELLSCEEQRHMEELRAYVIEDEGSWALGENFNALFARVFQDPQIPDDSRLYLLRIMAAAALKDDVILMLHQDRKEHTIMNFANRIESLNPSIQEALALFFCNMFQHLCPSEWLLYISEWQEGGQQISNIRVTTKVAVNALLHGKAKVQEYGTAIMYNLGTKEVKTVVFDDVAPELAMAVLQFFNGNQTEEYVWRTLTALSRFSLASNEVPQLIKMIGPEPSAFKGLSDRVDTVIEELSGRLDRIRVF